MNNLSKFQTRNKRRNKELYDKSKVENIDYIVCPVSKERMVMIKRNYVESVLLMKWDDYISKYPDQLLIAPSRIDKIKAGVNAVDDTTGLTKHQLSVVKSRVSLTTPDANGLTGDERRGKKTRNTHLNNVDENGLNGYQKQVYNRLNTVLENGLTVEQNAHKKQQETMTLTNVSGRKASKASKKALTPIIEWLEQNNLSYYFDNKEYGIWSPELNQFVYFDLTISALKINIEYQSCVFHPNPFILNESEWTEWKQVLGNRTADQAWNHDLIKAKSLWVNRRYETFWIWEKTYKSDVKDALERLECLLKMKDTIY